MAIKALIPNVNTDAELTALTGMLRNTLAYHTLNDSTYIYEPNFGGGYVSSIDGGYWVKDNVTLLDLEGYKALRYNEIDTKTGEKILSGFTYQGKVFSMSQNAQINILGLDNSRDDAALTYPIAYSTIDDLDNYDVINSADLHGMYLTALGTKKYHVDTGTVLKDSIRSAVNEIEVELIIDNR